jgi:hypothetical protein
LQERLHFDGTLRINNRTSKLQSRSHSAQGLIFYAMAWTCCAVLHAGRLAVFSDSGGGKRSWMCWNREKNREFCAMTVEIFKVPPKFANFALKTGNNREFRKSR